MLPAAPGAVGTGHGEAVLEQIPLAGSTAGDVAAALLEPVVHQLALLPSRMMVRLTLGAVHAQGVAEAGLAEVGDQQPPPGVQLQGEWMVRRCAAVARDIEAALACRRRAVVIGDDVVAGATAREYVVFYLLAAHPVVLDQGKPGEGLPLRHDFPFAGVEGQARWHRQQAQQQVARVVMRVPRTPGWMVGCALAGVARSMIEQAAAVLAGRVELARSAARAPPGRLANTNQPSKAHTLGHHLCPQYSTVTLIMPMRKPFISTVTGNGRRSASQQRGRGITPR